MTQDPSAGDPLSAALLQLMAQAERMVALDEREAGHYRETAGRLAELAGHAGQMSARLDDAAGTLGRQTAILDTLDGLDEQVAAIAARLTDLAPGGPASDDEGGKAYQPIQAPRWWQLAGEERDQAIARLRAWVEQIFAPGYGHLAPALPMCWDQHPLCLYLLDWLSELWSVLYLSPDRSTSALAGQAEWQTRYLPAAADQILAETTSCDHARPSMSGIAASGSPYLGNAR
jgi:hypothetical protein